MPEVIPEVRPHLRAQMLGQGLAQGVFGGARMSVYLPGTRGVLGKNNVLTAVLWGMRSSYLICAQPSSPLSLIYC